MSKLNSVEFKNLLDTNFNMQLIIAGMTGLVDDGFTARQVFDLLETAKQNTFHALLEIEKGDK